MLRRISENGRRDAVLGSKRSYARFNESRKSLKEDDDSSVEDDDNLNVEADDSADEDSGSDDETITISLTQDEANALKSLLSAIDDSGSSDAGSDDSDDSDDSGDDGSFDESALKRIARRRMLRRKAEARRRLLARKARLSENARNPLLRDTFSSSRRAR